MSNDDLLDSLYTDVMSTDLGDIYIPGLADLYHSGNSVAVTLEAMINLEIRQYLKGQGPPTQSMILEETIRLGSELSPKSQKSISHNIIKLIELGHVTYREGAAPDEAKKSRRGRGGKSTPWHTVYVRNLVSQALADLVK